jgi:two-component system OmpR family response regulator
VWQTTADLGSNVIEVHIKHLREKLGTLGDRIETVRSQGYRYKLEPE